MLKRSRACLWRSRWRSRLALAAVLSGGLASHIAYMLQVKFDYGWNMTLCLAAGITQSVAWVWWCARNCHPARCVFGS